MVKPFGELGDITKVYSQKKGFFEKSTTSCCTAARSCTKSQNRKKWAIYLTPIDLGVWRPYKLTLRVLGSLRLCFWPPEMVWTYYLWISWNWARSCTGNLKKAKITFFGQFWPIYGRKVAGTSKFFWFCKI